MAHVGTAFRVKLTGSRPLLMSSTAGYRPTGEAGARLRELFDKRKKTDADNAEIAPIKYRLALYHDEKLGPYLPGYNLWAACRDGAKIHKKGASWIRGVQIVEDKLPILYEGPRDPAEMYADGRFVDVRLGQPQGKTAIEVVRPIFSQWQLEATIVFNDQALSRSDVRLAVETAGEFIGDKLGPRGPRT
jgi:hypothetical protein